MRLQATGGGTVAMYVTDRFEQSTLPIVLIIHGALRAARTFYSWANRFEGVAEVVLVDLPCHARSSLLLPATVEALTQNVHEAACKLLEGRDVLVVGESLGGLVALAMAGKSDLGPLKAVVAADPPLTTSKQWSVINNFRVVMKNRPNDLRVRTVAEAAFGIFPDRIVERIYYPVVGMLRVPAMILTGDVPLHPPRFTNASPCLIDRVDRFTLDRLYPGKAELRTLQNAGHLLLHDAPDEAATHIMEMLARHILPPDAATSGVVQTSS